MMLVKVDVGNFGTGCFPNYRCKSAREPLFQTVNKY